MYMHAAHHIHCTHVQSWNMPRQAYKLLVVEKYQVPYYRERERESGRVHVHCSYMYKGTGRYMYIYMYVCTEKEWEVT